MVVDGWYTSAGNKLVDEDDWNGYSVSSGKDIWGERNTHASTGFGSID